MRTTLDDILGDFSPAQTEGRAPIKSGTTLTIWVPTDLKARYDRLQERSGRKFSKKAREVLLALIEMAEARS